MTEPVIKQPRHTLGTQSAKELLDALSSGTCDQDDFLRAVGETLPRVPDMGWELLALADQYYRRGKITSETFGSIKTHLHDLLMGKGRDEISAPLARNPREAPAASVTVAISAGSPADAGATRLASKPSSARPTFGFAPESPSAPLPAFAAAPKPAAPKPAAPASPINGPARAAESAFVTRPASVPLGAQVSTDESPDDPPYPCDRVPSEGDLLRGRYRVKGVLGQGGMGTVFEAVDQFRVDRSNGDQRVAIKVLHTAIVQRPRLFAELQREFQHLQSLSHANIVRVHEFDRDGDLAFFTMEYLSGALLSRIISNRESALFRPYALAIIRDVGSAVVHAHSRGVVHGDLNPGNIFITDNGEVRVLDFGASHELHHGPWISEFDALQHVPVATPSYASCQLLSGETADARDDLYALACVAYVLLAGIHPFDGQTALRARTLHLTPRRPSGLTRQQWHALQAGLRFEREQRPSDVRAWLERLDLDAAAHLPALPMLVKAPRRNRDYRQWAAVAAAIVCLAAVGWWAAGHVDSLTRAGDAAIAKWDSVLANTRPSRDAGRQAGDSTTGAATAPSPEPTSVPEPMDRTPSPPIGSPIGVPIGSPNGSPIGQPVADAATRASITPAIPGASGTSGVPYARGAAAPASTASQTAGKSPATSRFATAGSTVAAAVGTDAAATPASAASGQSGPIPYRARIELTSDSIEVTPDDTVARITVRRTRAMRGDADFSWWTESGTAKPGRDFVAVKSQVETIASGKNSASLIVPLVVDPSRHETRSFYVVIDAASDDAAVGPRTLTMVTIPGAD